MTDQTAMRPRFEWGTTIAIAFVHIAAILGLAFWNYTFSWAGLILCVVMVWATASLGISLTYHRLLSHGALRAEPALRTVLLCLCALTLEGGPIRWSATHRLHHRESDHEDDPHSPLKSFLWSHILWTFYTNPRLANDEMLKAYAPDLARDPQLRWFDRNFIWVWVAFALLTFGIGCAVGGLQLGVSLLLWGSFVRTVWVWHHTWFVNSATHLFGYRNYKTADDSRNLWWVAFFTFGEGWHNNHHAIAGSARFGHKWWEFDATWYALVVFKALGWVKNVNYGPRKGTERTFAGKVAALSAALKTRLAKGQRVVATE
jgi:sn-2 palmitoyl-lipid 9-desaturase